MCKFSNIYDSIISRAKDRNWTSASNRWKSLGTVEPNCYTETHHIIPKCLGGSNEHENLVVLTAKEHFVCHYLLTKIYPEEPGIVVAFSIMCNKTEGKTGKDYTVIREKFSSAMSEIGKKRWEEDDGTLREKYSKIGKELVSDPEYLKRVSDGVRRAYETTDLREKIAKSSRKNWMDEDYRKRHREAMKKVTTTTEFKENMSKAIKLNNLQNPEVKQKRLNAIKSHQQNKPIEWRDKAKNWLKEANDRPENRQKLIDRLTGSNNHMARKVINTKTLEIYDTAVEASNALGVNLSTIKKWMYKKVDKYNCLWYDDYVYLQGGNDE